MQNGSDEGDGDDINLIGASEPHPWTYVKWLPPIFKFFSAPSFFFLI